jgi:hypothetical protein
LVLVYNLPSDSLLLIQRLAQSLLILGDALLSSSNLRTIMRSGGTSALDGVSPEGSVQELRSDARNRVGTGADISRNLLKQFRLLSFFQI